MRLSFGSVLSHFNKSPSNVHHCGWRGNINSIYHAVFVSFYISILSPHEYRPMQMSCESIGRAIESNNLVHYSSVASLTIKSRYANIFVFLDCENNQFLKKSFVIIL